VLPPHLLCGVRHHVTACDSRVGARQRRGSLRSRTPSPAAAPAGRGAPARLRVWRRRRRAAASLAVLAGKPHSDRCQRASSAGDPVPRIHTAVGSTRCTRHRRSLPAEGPRRSGRGVR